MSFNVIISSGTEKRAVDILVYLDCCRAWRDNGQAQAVHIVGYPFDHGKKYLLTTYRLPGRTDPSFNITTICDFAKQNAFLLNADTTDTVWQSPLSLHATYEEARRAMIAAKPPRRDRIKPAPPTHGTPPPTPLPSTEPKTNPEPKQ